MSRVPDQAAAETMAGARETRPQMPPPAQQAPTDLSLRDRILDVVALYPEAKSAIIPALRLAQDEYGWLPTEAYEAVADATGFTPAYCKSVASFYDMFFLEPVGHHVIEVCTNVTCAMVGAGTVMAAFEEALGVSEGETTPDGLITLRKVECLGGCAFAPVVAVYERFHERFRPADAAGLVEQVRGGQGHRG